MDEKKVGKIKQNETKIFHIPPGKHEVYVRIDGIPSNKFKFSAEPGATVSLLVDLHRVSGFKRYLFLILFGLTLALSVTIPPYTLLGFVVAGAIFVYFKGRPRIRSRQMSRLA
jgi:hypothetical protein